MELDREDLLRDMNFPASFNRTLIVKSHPIHLKPEFVASALGRHCKDVSIRDRWVPTGVASTVNYWCGAVAKYDCILSARRAAKELRMLNRSIKTILFPEFISGVIDTEVRHRARIFDEFDESGVVIRGQLSHFSEEQARRLETALELFGRISEINFTYRAGDNSHGIICEAHYDYATPAIGASVMMNGLCYSKLGLITSELRQTKKLKKFVQQVEGTLVELMDNEESSDTPGCDCLSCITNDYFIL